MSYTSPTPFGSTPSDHFYEVGALASERDQRHERFTRFACFSPPSLPDTPPLNPICALREIAAIKKGWVAGPRMMWRNPQTGKWQIGLPAFDEFGIKLHLNF